MSTAAQLSANQANAQHSTGPLTDATKAISSRNNLRHGFRSGAILLPGEDPAEFDALFAELTEYYATPELAADAVTELRAIREMAEAEWCLRRVRASLADALTRRIAALTPDHPHANAITLQTLAIETLQQATGTSYSTWLRYESKFERQFDRAYKAWRDFHNDLRRAAAIDADTQMKQVLFRPMPSGWSALLASNVQPAPTPPQTPRNAPCPCGSGDKFKRCCGKNAPPMLSQAAEPPSPFTHDPRGTPKLRLLFSHRCAS